MGSLTNQILAGIQKMGCECSAICKTCINLNVPAGKEPCAGCKYGSMGGSKDSYTKKASGRDKLISSSIKRSETGSTPSTPTDTDNADSSHGGSGNVSNTPPAVGEKRSYDKNKVLLDVLNSLKK